MKNKVLLRAFFLTAMAGLALSLWAGGSSQPGPALSQTQGAYQRDPNLNPPGTFPINKTTVPLRIGLQQSATIENWETNWMTLMIERNGNYDLSFDIYPTGEMTQRFELMVLAGGVDLPDVLLGGFSLARMTRYGQAGMIVPVNDYYENSAHHINISMSTIDFDCLKYVTSYDGNIYGLYEYAPSLNNGYAVARIMIYEPWLQRLGLTMPQSIDEYLNVLRAFRDRDPNGNGIRDEIPLVGQRNNMLTNYPYTMMTPFIYTQPNFWMFNSNNRIDVPFNKPEWREGLRFTKQLIDEGLLSPLSFTQDAAQLTAMISPNPPRVGSYVGISTSMLGANDNKRIEYGILPPLQGPGGRQQVWSPTLPQIAMVITKNCQTPESAFMLGDYLGSEELSIITRWGEKGIDWFEPGPNEIGAYEESLGYPAIIRPVALWGVLQNKWWANLGPLIRDIKWGVGQAFAPDSLDSSISVGRTIGPAVQFTNRNPIIGLVYNEQEQEIMDNYHRTIITYVEESFARFVMGDLSIDRDWDRYVSEFNRMGLADVIRVTQSAWDRMNR